MTGQPSSGVAAIELPSGAESSRPRDARRVALACAVGTTIEWYDFFIYGTAAATVFGPLFFPQVSPLAGTLAAFATFGVGFVARPVGGIVMAHFGDRVGRKSMLVWSLMLMGLSTLGIGLLPDYASIGVWAPTLLVVFRLVQGFALGGEWGGAVLMAVEHAPPRARGFYGSWPQIGVPAGLLLANGVFSVFSGLPEEQFLSWGWRVPFLLSIVLVGIGLLIRVRILETPAFTRIKAAASEVHQPILEVVRKYPRQVLLAMGARFAENGGFYIYSVFVITYATQRGTFAQQTVLNGILLGAALELVAIPLFGALSDRIGRRPVYLFGAIVTAVFAYPLFWLIDTGSTPALWLAIAVAFVFSHAAMYAPQAAFLSELFDTRVRYSGASLGAQLASVFAGALAPLIATALLREGYGGGAIALYVVGLACVTIVSVLAASETHRKEIE